MLDWSVTSGLSLSTSVANTSAIIFKDLEKVFEDLSCCTFISKTT